MRAYREFGASVVPHPSLRSFAASLDPPRNETWACPGFASKSAQIGQARLAMGGRVAAAPQYIRLARKDLYMPCAGGTGSVVEDRDALRVAAALQRSHEGVDVGDLLVRDERGRVGGHLLGRPPPLEVEP